MSAVMKNKKPFIKRVLTKRNIIIAVIVAIVCVIGISLVSKPKEVTSYSLKKGSVKEELVISGSVRADKYSAMSFAGSGKLDWIGVKEGQEVYKGQALAKLDAKLLNSAYETAKSNVRSAEANAEYVLDNVKNHSTDESFYFKTTRTTAEVAKIGRAHV